MNKTPDTAAEAKHKVGDRVLVKLEATIVEVDETGPETLYLVEIDDVLEVCGLVIRTYRSEGDVVAST